MKPLRSLRSRLVVASLLWTMGLLAVMHMTSLMLMQVPSAFKMHSGWPFIGGLIFMIVGLSTLRAGLLPFRQLRTRLMAVRSGQERQVRGEYPTEVQPLVDDLNALLDDREKAIKRAQATAGDLAHGLKTPLAILSQEAERAGALGDSELAEGIAQQVVRMQRQVDYHLARARAAASGATASARCSVRVAADALTRTMAKLYASRVLCLDVRVSPDHEVRVQREDLDEILGNLLDNACKWAASRIEVKATRSESFLVISVEDDGPGIAPALRSRVLQRGVRADEAAPGSGLGLAIVRDLSELYGGSVSLAESSLGGVQARLLLPAWRDLPASSENTT